MRRAADVTDHSDDQERKIDMTKLYVPTMHCNHCVERIKKALDAAGISCEADLDTKTVKIFSDNVKDAIAILDDIGFDSSLNII